MTVTPSQERKMVAWLPQDGTTDSLCDCPVLWDSARGSTGCIRSGTFWPPSPMWSSNEPYQSLHIPGILCKLHQLQLGRITAQPGKFGGTAHMFKTERFLLQTNCKYSQKQLHLYRKTYSSLKARIHGSSQSVNCDTHLFLLFGKPHRCSINI